MTLPTDPTAGGFGVPPEAPPPAGQAAAVAAIRALLSVIRDLVEKVEDQLNNLSK